MLRHRQSHDSQTDKCNLICHDDDSNQKRCFANGRSTVASRFRRFVREIYWFTSDMIKWNETIRSNIREGRKMGKESRSADSRSDRPRSQNRRRFDHRSGSDPRWKAPPPLQTRRVNGLLQTTPSALRMGIRCSNRQRGLVKLPYRKGNMKT